jgi:tetratricopeptide (TPR) repeat protein
MLAKAPEDRYQSARELLRELRQVQLEHLDEEWPEDLPGWEITELDTAGVSLHETTQQLDTLMKTAGQAEGGRLRGLLWAAGLVTAFLVGAALAFFTIREEPLLAETGSGPQPIPKFENVFSQWVYAFNMGTEEAWQAVIDYFPDTHLANQARKQLAWLYLREDDYDRAEEVFKALAMLDASQQELRAFGLAGQYWVLTEQEEHQKAAEVLTEMLPILPRLRDRQMGRMVGHVFRKNQEATTNQQIQQWLEQLDQESQEASEAD